MMAAQFLEDDRRAKGEDVGVLLHGATRKAHGCGPLAAGFLHEDEFRGKPNGFCARDLERDEIVTVENRVAVDYRYVLRVWRGRIPLGVIPQMVEQHLQTVNQS